MHVFNRQSIHIALLLWGFIFCLIAFLCQFMNRSFTKEKRDIMLKMQFTCAVLLLNDALAWLFRGNPTQTGYFFVRFSNCLVFFSSYVLQFLFHRYVCFNIAWRGGDRLKKTLDALLVKTGYAIALVAMVIIVVSQFNDFCYHIDGHNFYHRNPGYYCVLSISFLGMMIDLALLIRHRKSISREIFVSMCSYIVLPLVATIIQAFYYGYSLINIAITISMILMFVLAMIDQGNELASKEKEAADMRISMMMSQIAPHFIYNTLTVIQGLCDTDPASAKETVGDFAMYLRGNLNSLSMTEPIPFEKELDHVKCYVSIEKKRFGDRVNAEYNIGVRNFLVPPLVLQPIVENAVKHGLCKKEGGGTVSVSTEEKGDVILITVVDDGAGFDENDMGKGRVGLDNVRERVESMCHGTISISSRKNLGTKVIISIPREVN